MSNITSANLQESSNISPKLKKKKKPYIFSIKFKTVKARICSLGIITMEMMLKGGNNIMSSVLSK